MSDEEVRNEEKNVLWKDIEEKVRSARKAKKSTNEPWKYSHPTSIPKQKLVSRAGKHKDAYYLDSGVSIHILFNRETLGDIEPLEEAKLIATESAGGLELSQIGSLSRAFEHLRLPKKGYYYDQNAMVNLLSLGQIAKEFTVKMNTAIDDAIYVYDEDRKYVRFARTKANLYCAYLHPDDREDKYYLLTVKDRKAMFSEADCRRAEAVRKLQSRLGHPSDVDLANTMEYNVLSPCDFNRRDIRIAHKILGPSAAAPKGKTTNSKSKMEVQEEVINDFPEEVLKKYRDVHIDVDIMYVNKIPFFTAISSNIELIHCREIASR